MFARGCAVGGAATGKHQTCMLMTGSECWAVYTVCHRGEQEVREKEREREGSVKTKGKRERGGEGGATHRQIKVGVGEGEANGGETRY